MSFSIQEFMNGSSCSLFFWKYDLSKLDDGGVVCSLPLFSTTGRISSKCIGFIATVIELDSAERVRYIVTGQNRDEPFMYFSFVFHDLSSVHYSFATNDARFRWRPSKCLLTSRLAVVANCLSSIKIIAAVEDQHFRLFQFDVEGFLAKQTRDDGQELESFEVDIIEKCEDRESVILSISYLFYSEERGKWYNVFTLLELPVDGKPFRPLHREALAYPSRPSESKLQEGLSLSIRQFQRIHLPVLHNFSFLTTETQGEVRTVPLPELNTIVIDDTNRP